MLCFLGQNEKQELGFHAAEAHGCIGFPFQGIMTSIVHNIRNLSRRLFAFPVSYCMGQLQSKIAISLTSSGSFKNENSFLHVILH